MDIASHGFTDLLFRNILMSRQNSIVVCFLRLRVLSGHRRDHIVTHKNTEDRSCSATVFIECRIDVAIKKTGSGHNSSNALILCRKVDLSDFSIHRILIFFYDLLKIRDRGIIRRKQSIESFFVAEKIAAAKGAVVFAS
ncbi:hypothetical protein D3C72_1940630 [compost metagenome]